MLPVLAVIIFIWQANYYYETFLATLLLSSCFLFCTPGHHNIHRYDNTKWECNVQNNRA